jgi:hypothetical protein
VGVVYGKCAGCGAGFRGHRNRKLCLKCAARGRHGYDVQCPVYFKNCEHCAKLFTARKSSARFCSQGCCQTAWRRSRGSVSRVSGVVKTCATCNKVFLSKSAKGRFCSAVCTDSMLPFRSRHLQLIYRTCSCGARLSHRNRTGQCVDCSDAEGKRQLRRRRELPDSYVRKLIVDANPQLRGRVSRGLIETKRLLVKVKHKILEVRRGKVIGAATERS